MQRHFRHLKSSEFLVLWVFLGVSLAGLTALTVSLFQLGAVSPAPIAPSAVEYRAEASAIMTPFLSQAELMTEADFAGDASGALRTLVTATQDRMLRLRVPGDFKETHLAFVLMLERWHRALDGDEAMRTAALGQMRDAVAANPWVRAENQSL